MNVSVIIPTFNRADMVGQAIESVLNQNVKADEIIVVDDGSTDDTQIRLSNFGDTIRIINQPNKGISAARNTGIKSAQCEWITFLDSDDLWKPSKLKKQKAFLRGHPDYQICYTDEEWRKNDKWVNPKKIHKKHGGWIYEHCLPRCIISASSVMMQRQVFEQFGVFDENLPACEDYDLWLRLSAQLPIGLVREKLIVKRDGPWEQLSYQHSLDKYRIIALTKMLNESLDPHLERQTRDMLAQKCNIYVIGCRKHNQRKNVEWIESIISEFHLTLDL